MRSRTVALLAVFLLLASSAAVLLSHDSGSDAVTDENLMFKIYAQDMYVGEHTPSEDQVFGAEYIWIYEKGKDSAMVQFLADPYNPGSSLPPSTGTTELKAGVTYTVYEFIWMKNYYVYEPIGNETVTLHLAVNLTSFPVDIPENEVHTFKLVSVDGNVPKDMYAGAVFLDSLDMPDSALSVTYNPTGTRVAQVDNHTVGIVLLSDMKEMSAVLEVSVKKDSMIPLTGTVFRTYDLNMFKAEFVWSGDSADKFVGDVWVYEYGKDSEMQDFLKDPYSKDSRVPDYTYETTFKSNTKYVVYTLRYGEDPYTFQFEWMSSQVNLAMEKNLGFAPISVPHNGYIRTQLNGVDVIDQGIVDVVAFTPDGRSATKVFDVGYSSLGSFIIPEPPSGYELRVGADSNSPTGQWIHYMSLDMNTTVPSGSPVVYAVICILITAFVGFLLFWNGRVPKID